MSRTEVSLYKRTRDDKIGISLQPGGKEAARGRGRGRLDEPVVVKALVAGGAAAVSGILVGDAVLAIDGEPVSSALDAASSLRDLVGRIRVSVERSDGLAMITGEETESDDGLSDEPSEDDIVGEWEQYLEWMVSRIMEREEELRLCQHETADALAESMLTIVEPSPPAEEDMADPLVMGQYMEAMAAYAQQQQQRLAHLDGEAEENREASAALLLCTARRQELEAILERVHVLNEEDSERIEAIWLELAGDPEDGEAGEGDSDGSEAEEAERQEECSAMGRVRVGSKQQLIAQRLQRARSSSLIGASRGAMRGPSAAVGAAVEPDEDDEVGCLIHPL